MKNTLKFVQKDNSNGSCDVFLNSREIDSCDMNFNDRYTQAHLVIASVWRTLATKEVAIEIIPSGGDIKPYPVENLKSMANIFIDENFQDTMGYTRVYNI